MTTLSRSEPPPPLEPWTWTGLYMGFGGYCLAMAMIATAQTVHLALITAMVGLVALSLRAPLDWRPRRASGGVVHDLMRRVSFLSVFALIWRFGDETGAWGGLLGFFR